MPSESPHYPIRFPDAGLRTPDDCVDVPADLELEPGR